MTAVAAGRYFSRVLNGLVEKSSFSRLTILGKECQFIKGGINYALDKLQQQLCGEISR